MKKVKMLYILNFAHRLNQFSYSSMLAARNLGLEYHIACNWDYPSIKARQADEEKYGIRIHQVDFMRNPLHPSNIKAYRQICRLIRDERYQVLHCNTPIGGALGRIAAKRFGIKPVIYQAHGFHFYQGAPLSSWLLYYPIEKLLARFTDSLITINREDYALARERMRLRKQGRVSYIPGIGIDTGAFAAIPADRQQKREELGIPPDAPLLLSVGELNGNKNHEVIIQAVAEIPNLHYAIAGTGDLFEHLRSLSAQFGISDRVHLLGYREDVQQIYKAADIFCLPSYREGLSASVMEAMASGLPVICSDIRGNRDLVKSHSGGFLVGVQDTRGYIAALKALAEDPVKRAAMAGFNIDRIKRFGLDRVTAMLQAEYLHALCPQTKGR